jgi:O-acetyl-ADP-ribose deacetylase (regulator of RNase III)
MRVIQGDLIRLSMGEECTPVFDVIIHGCNCQCAMGAGIAKTIKQKLPAAYAADLKTIKGSREKLGTVSHATVELGAHTLTIVNAYTQFDWRGSGSKVDYEAIRNAMKIVKQKFSRQRIGYPLIGAGLAGGDWKIISPILYEELAGCYHTLVEYVP